jgi:hypothetical protein
MISWMLGRGQFARQSLLSLNSGRAKHVEACDEDHQDRGSTPLASTFSNCPQVAYFSVKAALGANFWER